VNRLYSHSHDSNETRTARLYAVTAALADARLPQDVVTLMLHEAREATGAYGTTFHEVAPSGGTLLLTAALGYEADFLDRFRAIPLTRTFPHTRALEENIPVFLSAEELHQQYPDVAPERAGRTASVAILPLTVADDPFGTVALSFHDARAFDSGERDFLVALTGQCAQALQRARLALVERERREEAERTREQLASVITNVPGVVYRSQCNSEWTMHFISERIHDLTGRTADEFTRCHAPAPFVDVIHPDDREHVEGTVVRAVGQREPYDLEYRVQHLDGSVRWVHERGRAVYDNDGQCLWLDGVLLDVTERHQAEEERALLLARLQQEKTYLTAVLEQMPVAVWLAESPSGRLLFGNRRIQELWGFEFRRADVIEQYANYRAFHPDGREVAPHEWPLARAVVTGEIVTNEEMDVPCTDGTLRRAVFSAAPILNEEGERVAGVVTGQDITHLKDTEAALRAARDELEVRVRERTAQLEALSRELHEQVRTLEQRNLETRVVSEMSEMLQACFSVEEAQQVVAHHAEQLFPDACGALYAFGPSRNVLEETITWNGRARSTALFGPSDCWALRRGRTYHHDPGSLTPRCTHTAAAQPTLCVPLLAQGDTVGLLHLERHGLTPFGPEQQRVAQTVAETLALAIVNLRLRETLRQQSIRDALTGLFNRRYLEETFEREVRRAERHGEAVTVVMLDVDHFKTFNDTYGHEVGDILLRELGATLIQGVRVDDIPCRYGGEEFAILMPSVSASRAVERAEQLRVAIQNLSVRHAQGAPVRVTASLGVATYPEHGNTLQELLRAADFALYRAKHAGRNRVVMAAEPGGTGEQAP